jgi:hypothetical protein
MYGIEIDSEHPVPTKENDQSIGGHGVPTLQNK